MRRGGRRDALCKGCSRVLPGCVKSGAEDGPESTCVPDVLLCGVTRKNLRVILPGAARGSHHIKTCTNWRLPPQAVLLPLCVSVRACMITTQNREAV